MQYVNDHGSYHDVPAKFLMREMARDYARMQGENLSGRDMEREATRGEAWDEVAVRVEAKGALSGEASPDGFDVIRANANQIIPAAL